MSYTWSEVAREDNLVPSATTSSLGRSKEMRVSFKGFSKTGLLDASGPK